ncbi:unnamed protein product [Mytilus coruscus]|uniref:Uncharacterized protein n=1 Tax=Mytilus coruscus TaxID=42192 RepID=A0A6J7ZXT5_MYTCO|nr:unnamed protein product [Mytilus coruscus]
MEKSNSDDDSVEKNPQPVINISSNTDLNDDSNDSLTIREKEDVKTVEQLTKQLTVQDYVSSVPVDCIETSTFVIDTLALKDRDDLRIHMAGAIKKNRVQRDFVSVQMSDVCGRKRCSFFTNVHGNTKTANTPYVRTSKRVLADNGVGKRAKETFDVIFEDAGGMMHVSSPLELPRNTKQINNVKQTQKGAVAGKEKDSIFQLIKACKDQQSLADP